MYLPVSVHYINLVPVVLLEKSAPVLLGEKTFNLPPPPSLPKMFTTPPRAY